MSSTQIEAAHAARRNLKGIAACCGASKCGGAVLDLRREDLSYRIIARNLGMSPTTVTEIVRRAG